MKAFNPSMRKAKAEPGRSLEFEASLVCVAYSRMVRATQKDSVSKKRKKLLL